MKTSNVRKQAIVLVVSIVTASFYSGGAALSQGTTSTRPPSGGKHSKPYPFKNDAVKSSDQPPANFPVPIYTNNVVSAKYGEATSTDGRHSIVATIKTSDQPATAYQWYQQAVSSSGFEMYKMDPSRQKLPPNFQLYQIVADKGDQRLHLSCLRMPQMPETVISITVTSK
jgi:hypothetical protein